MSTEISDANTESGNNAIIVVFVLFSSVSVVMNLFAVVSIARHCTISICTLLVCLLSAIELLCAFACGATTLYSYLKTSENFENSSILCNFYTWLYVAFRIMCTLIVSCLVFDRVLLSLRTSFYVKQWISFRTKWIVPLSVFFVALLLALLSVIDSTSPDASRFHCLFNQTVIFSIFYIAFHFVQLFMSLVAIPCVIAREEREDAKLSVLLVGEMVVPRGKGNDVMSVRSHLKICRLVAGVVVLYHIFSILLPLILFLRLLGIHCPAVVGLLAVQLPTYCSVLLPLMYGFTWKPYRRAYYASLCFLCPVSATDTNTWRRALSVYNPAFYDTREYDANSIFTTSRVSLHQSLSEFDMRSTSTAPPSTTPSGPIELDPSQLTTHPDPSSSGRRPDILPRATSFQDEYRYIPSKFQSIFEIIEALSAPRRVANDNSSDLYDTEDSSYPLSPIHLNDMSLQLEIPDIFSGVNFSELTISSWPYDNEEKVINKSRLETQQPNSFEPFHFEEIKSKENSSEVLSPSVGAARFSDLKRAKSGPIVWDDPQFMRENRFICYLANESYRSNKET